jgi:hypothetical protein
VETYRLRRPRLPVSLPPLSRGLMPAVGPLWTVLAAIHVPSRPHRRQHIFRGAVRRPRAPGVPRVGRRVAHAEIKRAGQERLAGEVACPRWQPPRRRHCRPHTQRPRQTQRRLESGHGGGKGGGQDSRWRGGLGPRRTLPCACTIPGEEWRRSLAGRGCAQPGSGAAGRQRPGAAGAVRQAQQARGESPGNLEKWGCRASRRKRSRRAGSRVSKVLS